MRSSPSRRLRRFRRAAGLGLLGALVLLASATPSPAKKHRYVPYLVVPDVGDPKGPPVTDTIEIHREGVNAEISYVTGVKRKRMMKATLGIDFDPFATASDREPFFHTFLVSLENGSSREFHFNPSTARVVSSKEQVAYALDYTALYQGVGRSANLTMDQLHQVAYDRNLTLEPGDKVRKLLVFEQWPGKWDGLFLAIGLEADGLSGLEIGAPFRKHVLKPGETAP